MRIRRYAQLAAIFAGASVSAQLEYRVNFVINLIGSLLMAGGALFGLLILTGDGQPIGGWSYREATVVVGLFTFVQGFIGCFLQPNLNKIAETVRLGTMDFTLLKPVDTQFYVSTRNVNVFRLADVIVGMVIVVWAASGLPNVTLGGVLAGVALVCAALAIVYAVWFMLATTAFWFVKVENATELFLGLFRAGQFPATALPGWVRFLFTFIIPIAFITTVPAEAITGRIEAGSALAALIVAVVLLLLSRSFLFLAVRNYTSASS